MGNVDFGKIVKRSWEVTWNNKWLWVVGLVLAAFSGGGSYRSSGSGGSSSHSSVPSASPSPSNFQELRNQTSNVLGAATDAIRSWFENIPPQNWVFLVLGLLILIIFIVVLKWILVSWAKGALIAGFEDAESGKEVNLSSMTPYGIKKIKDLIIFGLVSFGVSVLLILAFGSIILIGLVVKALVPVLGIIWLVLFGIVGGLALIVGLVLFSMLGVYAERLIVLKNFSAWDAWKKGFSLTKGNFLPTIVMSIINSVIGCTAGCLELLASLIIFAVPGFLLIYPIFKDGFKFPGVGQLFGILVIVFLFGSVNLLFRAIMVVFDTGTWNLFFKKILENEQQ